MIDAEDPGFSPDWLAMRERADAAARAGELLDPLRTRLAGTPRPVIHDLGCGTGSMGRWLAARLAGAQHWVLHDRDRRLLRRAAATMAGAAADGAPVTVETRLHDVTALDAADLAGASLVTASALLDVLTAAEVDRLAGACVEAGCPALLTLSVSGQAELSPADPLDGEIEAAFNAHQRRPVDGRRLLGPDAVEVVAESFERRGATVRVRPAPWRLGPDDATLTAHWIASWVAAACAQRPELTAEAAGYLRRRTAAAGAGELDLVVHHSDVLAQPG